MKKLLIITLVLLMLFPAAKSEQAVTFHSAFGLSEGATQEDIEKALQKTFLASPSEIDKSMFFVESQFLYDLPISWITGGAYEMSGRYVSSISISFEDETLTPENILSLYQNLCQEYGDPTVCNISRETTGMSGKQKEEVSITDLDSLRLAIDQHTLSGLVCWDNISLEFASSLFEFMEAIRESKRFKINAAFSDASLSIPVQDLYGLNPYKQQ